MADYFLDSSAIVKRYINEMGSAFVDELIGPDRENNIFIAEITRAEVASAFARREKGKTLTTGDAATARDAFAVDVADVYAIIDITPELITNAADLATKHAVRGYDAVQLAAALTANLNLTAGGHSVLTFVSADGDLNLAAVAERLTVENPNDH